MDILHCFLCIFPRYSKTYSSAAVKPLTVFSRLCASPKLNICSDSQRLVFIPLPPFISFALDFSRKPKRLCASDRRQYYRCVRVCCASAVWENSLWRLSICQSERKTEPHRPDLPSCSASCRHPWNRLPGVHLTRDAFQRRPLHWQTRAAGRGAAVPATPLSLFHN